MVGQLRNEFMAEKNKDAVLEKEEEGVVPAKPEKVKKVGAILRDTLGKEVDEKDYFWPARERDKDGKETGKITHYAPSYFHKQNGDPVVREDLLEVFNKIFNPKDGFLFYKDRYSEVYLVIVPLKHAGTVGEEFNSIGSDFQKHAISFINEGSVNLETLKRKLTLIRNHKTIKWED